MITVSADRLKRQLALVFEAWGFTAEHIPTIVELMVEADLRGIDSHGVGKMGLYEQHFREGKLNPRPEVRVVVDLPTLAQVDGDFGMGHVASKRAMELAMEKAAVLGIGAVSVRHSYHIGATGVYSTMAAERGLIGLGMTGATQRSLVPTFGRVSRLATNPIAFAAQPRRNPMFSLDMATATVAVGKIDVARWLGKPIPVGWAMNADGEPETDAAAALAVEPKRLTPLGGTREGGSHKGYGLAVMVEILCSILGGTKVAGHDLTTDSRDGPIDVGHFYLAIDPGFFRVSREEFAEALDTALDRLRATPPADPAQPVLVPGDPEHAARAERVVSGIPISPALVEEVREIAGRAGADFILDRPA